jgi:hypothetical protein
MVFAKGIRPISATKSVGRNMAKIIRFPVEALAGRPKPLETVAPGSPRSGQIMIFTGIRYSRDEGGQGRQGGGGRGRRSKRAKAS